jgi:hypothetical protein
MGLLGFGLDWASEYYNIIDGQLIEYLCRYYQRTVLSTSRNSDFNICRMGYELLDSTVRGIYYLKLTITHIEIF